jgi:RNA polymerase sigma-70 factor, ECF subfamily
MAAEEVGTDIEQLVAEHHQAVYRYAYRLTGSVPDAEDLSQQIFLAAQQNLAQLRTAERARSWLLAMVRNGFLKTVRKRQPASAGSLELNIDNIPAQIPDDDQIDRERLQAALAELPPAFRVVVLMFYFEDRSYREIAEELQLPIGTVMSRLARAKAYLRANLFEPETPTGQQRSPTSAQRR